MTDFTKLHPATALWWEQRDRCRACAHHVQQGFTHNSDGSLGERCAAVKLIDMRTVPTYEEHPDILRHRKKPRTSHSAGRGRAQMPAYCIDARLEDAPCGPNAKLFKEKS
jgi:hypothetical protein